MSELLDGKKERQGILKEIIKDLHRGKSVEEVKERFAKLIKDVGATEISQMEQSLIAEGIPEQEIKRLCDVHVMVFKESLDAQTKEETPPGHPVHTFIMENRQIEMVVQSLQEILNEIKGASSEALADYRQALLNELQLLSEIDKHYLRKENQLFPLLEQKGVQGPTRVMWQFHDDVRRILKELRQALEDHNSQALLEKGDQLTTTISDMIYKEENILFPMALENLSEPDWVKVRQGEEEIGYAFVTPGNQWQPVQVEQSEHIQATQGTNSGSEIKLDTGNLTPEQINLLLTHLPVDVTYVDEHNRVRYYSQGMHRIFPRSPGIIGRDVANCHPASSVNIVNKIVEEFKNNNKSEAEFWLEMNNRFIHIRYFAVRDQQGQYRGVVEVTQDVTDIRALKGQRRLLDW